MTALCRAVCFHSVSLGEILCSTVDVCFCYNGIRGIAVLTEEGLLC